MSGWSEKDVLEHALASLEQARVHDTPFSHFFVENLFPADFYRALLDNLPNSSDYQPLDADKKSPYGESTRSFYRLDQSGLAPLSRGPRELWNTLVGAIVAPEYRRQIFSMLRRDLAYRFRIPEEEAEAIEAEAIPQLFRDVAGYRILPHPDTRKKIVTMMVYLPADDRQSDLGTSLYRLRPSLAGLRSKRGWFEEVKRFPFLPNSAFAFVVNNTLRKKSWHGRELLEDDNVARHSLIGTFYQPGVQSFQRYRESDAPLRRSA